MKTTKEIITPNNNNFFVLIRKEKHFRCIFSVRKNEHFECIYLCSKWPINIHCFYFHCNFFNQIFLTKSRDDIRLRLHCTVFDRQELQRCCSGSWDFEDKPLNLFCKGAIDCSIAKNAKEIFIEAKAFRYFSLRSTPNLFSNHIVDF